MIHRVLHPLLAAALLLSSGLSCCAAQGAPHLDLSSLNLDKRTGQTDAAGPRKQGLAHLLELAPETDVDFDPFVGTPKWIYNRHGFLSGPDATGKAISLKARQGIAPDDVHKAIKAFLNEHAVLFGHDAKALIGSRVIRDCRSAHNGLQTTVWEQELDAIPIFGAVLIGHTTAAGELVNISSQFVPDLEHVVKQPSRPVLARVSASGAVLFAARNLGEELINNDVTADLGKNGRANLLRFSARQFT